MLCQAVFGNDVYVHRNQARKSRGFMQNQSLPFLEVGAFPIGTEVNFAILLSKDWVVFNFCSDTIVEETGIYIFRIFVQTVKAN